MNNVDELIDPTLRMTPPTLVFEVMNKSFEYLSTPYQVMLDNDDQLVEMSELIGEDTTMVDVYNDIVENYRMVLPVDTMEAIMSRLIVTYANYLQSQWGEDSQRDPVDELYLEYFDEGRPLRDVISMSRMLFANEYHNLIMQYRTISVNVETLYGNIINNYEVIAEASLPIDRLEQDPQGFTNEEVQELWYRITQDSQRSNFENVIDPPTIEQVDEAISRGLNVIVSDPIHVDYKVSGNLEFDSRLMLPQLQSLVEYSRIIDDPNVDTVSGHVITSHYPHLGHIAKYLSPTSNGRYMYEYLKTTDQVPMIIYTNGRGQRFTKYHEEDAEYASQYSRLLIKNLRSYDDLITARPKFNVTRVLRGSPPLVEVRSEYEEDYDTIQIIYLQSPEDPKSAVNIILNTIDGTFRGILDAEYGTDLDIPPLKFSNLEPIEYTGHFNIYDVQFNDIIFNDIVVNDPVVSTMITISEVTNLVVDKMSQTYIYRVPTREQMNNVGLESLPLPEIRFNISRTLNNDINMAPLGVPKITVSYQNVETLDQLNSFIEFMRALMLYIDNNSDSIIDIYSQYIDIESDDTRMLNRDKLAAINPAMFGRGTGYTTTCSSHQQPTYIDMQDPNDFDNKVTNNPIIRPNGSEEERTWMTYPRGDNEVTVTCMGDQYPYIALRASRADTRATYDYVPCCVGSSTNRGHIMAMIYNETGRITTTETPIEHLINARILNPGIRSRLEFTNLIYILNDYLDFGVDRIVPNRIGIDRTVDSFLDACNILIHESIGVVTREDILDMIDERKLFLSVCKQECYDMTIDEMYNELANMSQYIDPRKYYRLFEELFDVNIYVLEVHSNIEFQVPRHRRYHIRTLKQRPSILILQNDVVGYPQYEPIILYDDSNDSISLLTRVIGSEYSSGLHELYSMTNRTLNEDFQRVPDPNTIDIDESMKYQLIDQYGKLRGIVYDDPEMTIMIEPNQPLNLPMLITDGSSLPSLDNLDIDIRGRLESLEDYVAVSIEYVGDSDDISRQGIWLDQASGTYFIPVSVQLDLDDVPIRTYPNFLSTYNTELIEFKDSYRDNRMTLNTVLQFSMMLLDYYYPNSDFVPDDVLRISDIDYDVSKIPRILPRNITWAQAASMCNFVIPSRTNPDRGYIIVKDSDMIDGFYYYLDRRMELGLRQGNVIRDRYEFQIPTLDTLKFSSELELVRWIQSSQYQVQFKDSIVATSYTSIYPYVYRLEDRYYLIQPIYSGDDQGPLRATRVSRTWKSERINEGYYMSVSEEIEGISTGITNNQLEDVSADYFVLHGKCFAILPMR